MLRNTEIITEVNGILFITQYSTIRLSHLQWYKSLLESCDDIQHQLTFVYDCYFPLLIFFSLLIFNQIFMNCVILLILLWRHKSLIQKCMKTKISEKKNIIVDDTKNHKPKCPYIYFTLFANFKILNISAKIYMYYKIFTFHTYLQS